MNSLLFISLITNIAAATPTQSLTRSTKSNSLVGSSTFMLSSINPMPHPIKIITHQLQPHSSPYKHKVIPKRKYNTRCALERTLWKPLFKPNLSSHSRKPSLSFTVPAASCNVRRRIVRAAAMSRIP